MTQPTQHFKIAMPQDVKDWLSRTAPRHQRSRSAHIIFLLRQEMEKEKAPDPAVGSKSDAFVTNNE